MSRVAIIAAMFREVHPLVRNMEPIKYLPDRRVQMYQSKSAVIAYAGMGREHASLAARAVLASGEVSALVSVGWAGGLNPNVPAGKVVQPATVIDASSGSRYAAGGDGGTLVTVQLVAGLEEKRRLGEQYNGDYVDMEAAAVAECAQEARLPFYCFKAISDAHDARLPDMNQFNRNGRFSAWRFIAHVAVRPALWQTVSDLSRASLDSRDALCKRLEQWLAEHRASPTLRRTAEQ
jgi:adenosylhomocysteine nucleosidase